MVYVDELKRTNWKYRYSCHMLANTKKELIAFAVGIGLKEPWLQKSRRGIWHFDLNENMRNKALAAGAKGWQTMPDPERRAWEAYRRELGLDEDARITMTHGSLMDQAEEALGKAIKQFLLERDDANSKLAAPAAPGD